MSIFRTAQPFVRPAKVHIPAAEAASTRTFRLVRATDTDVLLCEELDANGTVNPDAHLVSVAKTRELQRTWQDGRIDTLGRFHRFDSAFQQRVTRGGIAEVWIVIPQFQVGDQIQVLSVVHTGITQNNIPLTLIDANLAARAWAAIEVV